MQVNSSAFPIIQSSAAVTGTLVQPTFSAVLGSVASQPAIISAPAANPILNLSCPQEFGNVVTINGVQYVRQEPANPQTAPRYPEAAPANPIIIVISNPGVPGVSSSAVSGPSVIPESRVTSEAPDQNSWPEPMVTDQQSDPQLDNEPEDLVQDEPAVTEQPTGNRGIAQNTSSFRISSHLGLRFFMC